MKVEDVLKLKPGQKVIHRRYGVCIVKEVMAVYGNGELFGVVIRPDNKNGQALLLQDCGCNVPDLLEDQTRNISIEKAPAEPGEKPIDHLTAWGVSEEDMPEQKQKDYFAPKYEQEITGYQPDEDSESANKNLPTSKDTIE